MPDQSVRRVSVSGGDPTGHHIFSKQWPDGPALLWSGGELTELTGPDGTGQAWIAGVNSSGVVAGTPARRQLRLHPVGARDLHSGNERRKRYLLAALTLECVALYVLALGTAWLLLSL